MKKYLLTLIAGALAAGTINAQQRISILEDMAGENCPPCAYYAPMTDSFVAANNGKLLLLAYMVNIPSGGTLYNTTKSFVDPRRSYYGISSAPNARLNGKVFGTTGHPAQLTQAMVDADNATAPPFIITSKHEWKSGDDSIKVTVTIKAVGADFNTTGMKLFIAMTEDLHYTTPPGTTTQKDFHATVRQMFPNNDWSGTTLPATIKKDSTYTVTYTEPRKTWVASSNLTHAIAFIQNSSDKSILSAYQSPAAWKAGVREVNTGNKMLVYPNPATSKAYVSVDFDKVSIGNVIVTDLMGRTVYNSGALEFAARNNTVVIPTDNLASGFYNVTIATEEGKLTQRLNVVK